MLFPRLDQKQVDKFHAHLDVCSQCRNSPFFMCPMGNLLLRLTVKGK